MGKQTTRMGGRLIFMGPATSDEENEAMAKGFDKALEKELKRDEKKKQRRAKKGGAK